MASSGKWSRRQVIQAGLAGAGALGLSRWARPASGALGANERIRVAVAGINGRGGALIDAFAGMDGVEVACLVDPDRRLFDNRVRQVEEKSKAGRRPQCVQDIRTVLEDKTIDAVGIATPNHWHTLMTLWALQAGKDVYVEKPLSHNVHEGRVLVEAARKYNRLVQHGTQRRSDRRWAEVIAAIHSGKLGRLLVARGLCYKQRNSIGFKPVEPPPPELEFNLWLGPAPQTDYHANLVHYNWHWFWDFGNGDIGNQGVHQMDVALWGIRGATLPASVISCGGRWGYEDQGQTPNTQLAFMDFGPTLLIFEVRGLKTDKYLGAAVGNIFHLEAGTIVEHTFYPAGSDKPEPLPEVDAPLGPGDGPFANFIAAMRSRRESDLNAPVLEGHYASALGHLANVSYRCGERTPVSTWKEALGDHKDVQETLERMLQHLADNGLDPASLTGQMGRKLMIDAKSERITNAPEANDLLFASYREGFRVPASV